MVQILQAYRVFVPMDGIFQAKLNGGLCYPMLAAKANMSVLPILIISLNRWLPLQAGNTVLGDVLLEISKLPITKQGSMHFLLEVCI